MRFRIAGIWIMWVLVMAVLVGVTWVLMMFPLPGGSSGTPTLEEIVGFLAHVGVIGTIKILAVLFLPPIVLTYLEIRRTPGSPTAAPRTRSRSMSSRVFAELRRALESHRKS